MSKLFTGSICLTDLGEHTRNGHTAITTASNGKKYAAIEIWLNDTPDQYGNDISLKLRSSKDGREKGEKAAYIGKAKNQEAKPITVPETEEPKFNDLPF